MLVNRQTLVNGTVSDELLLLVRLLGLVDLTVVVVMMTVIMITNLISVVIVTVNTDTVDIRGGNMKVACYIASTHPAI